MPSGVPLAAGLGSGGCGSRGSVWSLGLSRGAVPRGAGVLPQLIGALPNIDFSNLKSSWLPGKG